MKKTTIFSILLSSFVAMAILSSCKDKTSDTNENRIEYDSIVVTDNIQLIEVNDTTLPYSDVNINFLYPKKFKNEEDLKRLQKIFIGTFFSNVHLDTLSPEDAMDEFVGEYKEEYQSLSNTYYEDVQRLTDGNSIPMWYWYSLNLENKVLFQNNSLVSYAVQYSDYTGGAHGSYRVTYTNIDLNELTTVSEEDIFVPNYQQELARVIVKRLMIQNNVTTKEGLLEVGFFDIDEIFPNNNFWISNDGIHYAFNQYEIAPYVMGTIEVNIPFEDLRGLLKTENGIEKLVSIKEQ